LVKESQEESQIGELQASLKHKKESPKEGLKRWGGEVYEKGGHKSLEDGSALELNKRCFGGQARFKKPVYKNESDRGYQQGAGRSDRNGRRKNSQCSKTKNIGGKMGDEGLFRTKPSKLLWRKLG